MAPDECTTPTTVVGTELNSYEQASDGDKEAQTMACEPVRTDNDFAKQAASKDSTKMPTGFKLYALAFALLLSEVLVGLDQTIVANATTIVANEFNSLSDIGWYGSAYLLTSAVFIPAASRAYVLFNKKWTFMFAIIIFNLGSLVSAVAQNSPVFIVGRALQGFGYAFCFTGVLYISAASMPVHTLPKFTSFMNLSYGTGTILGPLLGGVLTTSVSWRFCFWINLPPGGITLVIIFFFCNPPVEKQTLSVVQRLLRMDWPGAALLLGSTTCLLVALQEGGVKTPWNSGRIIGLFLGFGLMLIAFFVLQYYLGEESSISLRLLRGRSIGFTAIVNWCCGASYYSILYYIPIYFQAVLGFSPLKSGVATLALILPNMIAGIVAGYCVTAFGWFHPEMLVGTICTAIGTGLFALMDQTTSSSAWIGYQVLASTGMGTWYMLGFLASQILLPKQDRAKGANIVIYSQLIGATYWVSASESIYQTTFARGLSQIPGVDKEAVLGAGVSGFRQFVPAEILPQVVSVAVNGLFNVFVAAAVIAGFAALMVLCIPWRRMKRDEPDDDDLGISKSEAKDESVQA
ncbi:hypothetical protein OIV83_004398 [Microbotryomycetes sp. JL201]|nr:hypothetical protein OIV83_004398 [Microbotryomycetes sp. JL201]